MTKNKKIGIIGMFTILAIALAAFLGMQLNKPAYTFKLDVNPSIEIVSTRLDKVLEVNPLNEDATEMLKDFKIKDNDLEDTIEDIADLMVLSGYISGGKDNYVMITVNDKTADSDRVNKLNEAIRAYLENKQIEATIFNQTISEELDNNNTGGQLFAMRLEELDDDLSYEELANLTIKDLFQISEARNIDPDLLFSYALAYTVDENKYNKKEVDIELDDGEAKTIDSSSNKVYIGKAKAEEIALNKVGGGKVVEFKLDDDEYDIEIYFDGYEYELEINAYTGKIIEFEKDRLDTDKRTTTSSNQTEKATTKSTEKAATTKATEESTTKATEKTTTKATEKTTTKATEKSTEKSTTKTSTSSPSEKTRIGREKAEQIALGHAGGGKIVEFELDDDEYEIEIHYNGYEYEYEIHAYTGKILEYEKDDID